MKERIIDAFDSFLDDKPTNRKIDKIVDEIKSDIISVENSIKSNINSLRNEFSERLYSSEKKFLDLESKSVTKDRLYGELEDVKMFSLLTSNDLKNKINQDIEECKERDITHNELLGVGEDDHHPKEHGIDSHTDTHVRGGDLDLLVSGKNADRLHTHSFQFMKGGGGGFRDGSKITQGDYESEYLEDKISASSGITISKTSDADGRESLSIASDNAGNYVELFVDETITTDTAYFYVDTSSKVMRVGYKDGDGVETDLIHQSFG